MATITATAMIGHGQPRYGGIAPTHLLLLDESDEPALNLYEMKPRGALSRLATWTPTSENMIEDVILMAGSLTGAQPGVAEALQSICGGNLSRVDLFCMCDTDRTGLYALSRRSPVARKIVLTVLEDSALVDQVDRLRGYEADCELCVSARAKTHISGMEVVR